MDDNLDLYITLRLFPGERVPTPRPAAPETRPCSLSEWSEAAEWRRQDAEEQGR
jgi:hypothetical protein